MLNVIGDYVIIMLAYRRLLTMHLHGKAAVTANEARKAICPRL